MLKRILDALLIRYWFLTIPVCSFLVPLPFSCSSSSPAAAIATSPAVERNEKLVCIFAIQTSPRSVELAKQLGLTVDEFAMRACDVPFAIANVLAPPDAGAASAGAPSQ